MNRRFTLWAAAFLGACVALWACPGREPPPGGDAGCIGVCSTDGGEDGGADGGEDGGMDAGGPACVVDGGMSLSDLRNRTPDGGYVTVQCVVVRYTPYWAFQLYGSSQIPENKGEFWVADPNDPDAGYWINKYWTDNPKVYAIDAGDIVNITAPQMVEGSTFDQFGYRPKLGSISGVSMTITVVGHGPVPGAKEMTAADFADSDGGHVAARADLAGAYVHIAGPLTITDSAPATLWTLHYGLDGGDTAYNGFVVTGEIPVDDSETYRGCDWGGIARDGGAITFQNGISGIWDTYTMSPCPANFKATQLPDGGLSTSCGTSHLAGYVPDTDAGAGVPLKYTYVLYPLNCVTDLDGGVQ